MTKEEQVFLRHMKDMASRSYYEDRPCFSDFLNMYEQDLLLRNKEDILAETGAKNIFFYGGFPQAERVVAAFAAETPKSWPVIWLYIAPAYPRFAAVPGHRDYLGSILGLGLRREKIGDILVQEKGAWVCVRQETGAFILDELTQVGHTAVHVEQAQLPEAYQTPRLEICQKTVSSIRLDAILSAAYGLSRSKAAQCVLNGEVFINGRLTVSGSHTLQSEDIISVRHKGKFVFIDLRNRSKKNKCIIEIRKYV